MKGKFKIKSSSEGKDIECWIWMPEKDKAKAILQISHGMTEYIKKYEELATFLNNKGIIVVRK